MAQANSFVQDLVVKADHVLDHVHVNIAQPGNRNSRLPKSSPVEDGIQLLSASRRSGSGLHGTRSIRASLSAQPATATHDEQLLQWVLVGKATSQTYGVVLDTLLRQILPLNDDITYWSEVLDSVRYTAFYSLQTAPLRLWTWSRDAYHEVRTNENLAQDSWNDFYSVVRSVVRTRSIADARASIALPTAVIRNEIQSKISHLQRTKSAYAASIGLLLSHGFDSSRGLQSLDTSSARSSDILAQPWRDKIADTVRMMDAVFRIDTQSDTWHASLDTAASQATSAAGTLDLPALQARLTHIIDAALPAHLTTFDRALATSGRPPPLVRYWPLATAALLSSSTVLRVVLARRAALATWAAEAGTTALAFWRNWVLEPAQRLLATIRHDDAADMALVSRASLAADRASLERMAVSFALDTASPGAPAPDAAAVRAAVAEGDLTPVLRAYEADLAAPLSRALRGNLVRALLIQVQKTKVDIQLAVRGIDSLLQSQQLVFGLVSLTPGLLVVVAAARWVAARLSRRSGRARGRARASGPALLRNVDRVLGGGDADARGVLPFEPFGLLVVEAVLLRELAAEAMPRAVFREFLGDFDELIDVKRGVTGQRRAADRIRWGYAQWFGTGGV